jgi:predicted SnoaL-like aldol condensation-catalyzing enzyme
MTKGDLGPIHSHYETLGMADAEFFRCNCKGKSIEHWDVLQQVRTPPPAANDTFSRLT